MNGEGGCPIIHHFRGPRNTATGQRDTAEETRRTAMVCHEFRYTPQRAYIKQLLASEYNG